MKAASNLSRIGFISKLNGFSGEVVLIIESSDFKTVSKSKFFFINLDGIPVPFAVENIFEKGAKVILKLEGVNDAEYPKRFMGRDVLIEQKRSASKKKELTWDSLVGYELIDVKSGPVGVIERIEEMPQQMMATCMVKGKEVFIPLHDDLIDHIDDDAQKLFAILPEGLLDVYLD